MANSHFLGDKDIAKLLLRADSEEDSAFSILNSNGYEKEVLEIRAAIQNNDLGRMQNVLKGMNDILPAPEYTMVKNAFRLREQVETVKMYQELTTRKNKNEQLNKKEEQILSYLSTEGSDGKGPLGEQFAAQLKKKYAKELHEFSVESDFLDNENKSQTQTDNSLDMKNEPTVISYEQENTPEIEKTEMSTNSDLNPIKMTYNTEDKPDATPLSQTSNTTQSNESPLTQEQEKQAAQEAAEDREEFNNEATISLGDKTKDVYGAGTDDQFADPKSFDWFAFRKETMWDPLQKAASEKTMADMALAMFTAVILDSPAKMLANWQKQRHDIKKEDKKTQKTNRDNAIDANLKQRGLNRNDLVSDLAHKSKAWILDDSVVKNLPTSSLTKVQKAHLRKYKFAQSLPKTKDGDLDFGKFSSAQLKKYQDYVMTYATLPEWRNDAQEKMGVRLKQDELENQAKIAHEMKIKKPNILLTDSQKEEVLDDLRDATRMVGAPRHKDGSLNFSQFTTEDVKEYQETIEREYRDLNKLTPDSITVKGKLDNPTIKRTEDGQIWTIGGKTLEEIEEESKKIRRQIRLLAEQRQQQQENERAVQQSRNNANGQQQQVNINTGRGGRTQ